MRKFISAILLAGAAAGCTTDGGSSISPDSGGGVSRANSVIASEFTSLVFSTENGTRIPRLLKYEAPIRVALDPRLNAYRSDLAQVLGQMRNKAGIDIAITAGSAQINIEQVPAAALRQVYPTAACVVVPGVSSFSQFRRGNFVRWSHQRSLEQAAIFIPDNSPPYIVRACLNEEIAQALGPVNDLYRISDTVFNDDNVYNALTRYDLLILRILYSDELHSGMSEATVRAKLPALLANANPQGHQQGQANRSDSRWKTLIETAMNSGNPRPTRIRAAEQAIQRGRRMGDHRLAHALLIYGRLTLQNSPELAAPAFEEAYSLNLSQLGPDNLRTALTGMHMGAVAIAAGQFNEVITLTSPALATAQRFNDPVMMAGIQGMRALAFTQLGQNRQAEAARLDSLAQARYAFGENAAQIAAAQAQIDGLLPRNN